MPSLQTWKQVLDAEDLHFNSSVILSRNSTFPTFISNRQYLIHSDHYPPGTLNSTDDYNSTQGMAEMTIAAQQWFPTPSKTCPISNFSAWCHTTQLFQAAYYVNQIAFYRRGAGLPQRTLGSLYWQLEDIWQAPTWAGIEYDGRWKVLHYRAKDAYQRMTVYPFFDKGMRSVEVWVMSDLWDEVRGTVNVTWYDWAGHEKKHLGGLYQHPFRVGAINATRVYSENMPSNALVAADSDLGLDTHDLVVRVSITASGHVPDSVAGSIFHHETWMAASRLSAAKLQDPGLVLTYDGTQHIFTVEATKAIASWVWLDYPSGAVVEFEDNGFWLAKGEKRTIGFKVKRNDTSGRWLRGVTVQSLWNNTLAE